jgi:hypothetical protein
MYKKTKDGCRVTHSFTNPTDVVIEKICDEYIVEIDCGTPNERTFTFNKMFIDIFDGDDEILMGIVNPDQLQPFFHVEELLVEYERDGGIGYIEIH